MLFKFNNAHFVNPCWLRVTMLTQRHFVTECSRIPGRPARRHSARHLLHLVDQVRVLHDHELAGGGLLRQQQGHLHGRLRRERDVERRCKSTGGRPLGHRVDGKGRRQWSPSTCGWKPNGAKGTNGRRRSLVAGCGCPGHSCLLGPPRCANAVLKAGALVGQE